MKFSKAEKIVLIGGIVMILLIVGLGFAKQTFIDKNKKPFEVPAGSEVSTNDTNKSTDSGIDGITLKKTSFTVDLNGKLDTKTATYVTASDDIMKNIKIDFDAVDTTKPGKYQAVLSYDGDSVDIPIVVKDTTAPVITVSNAVVEFTIEPSSTLEELKTFVNATVEDDYDGTISSDKVEGWPTALSTVNETKKYTLTVKDSSGNVGKKEITVQYIVPAANTETPAE